MSCFNCRDLSQPSHEHRPSDERDRRQHQSAGTYQLVAGSVATMAGEAFRQNLDQLVMGRPGLFHLTTETGAR